MDLIFAVNFGISATDADADADADADMAATKYRRHDFWWV